MEPLTVAGSLESLSIIGAYVAAAANEAELEKKAAYRLRLAVDEIATNSIVHGYQEQGTEGSLTVSADIGADALTIFLEDTARQYDPRQTVLPDDLDAPIEQRKMGGLGVYLTVQGVDTFLHEYVGDRNRNIFVINRKAGKSQAKTHLLGRLLIVDARELERNMLSRQLDALGYEMTAAKNEREALERIGLHSFDLVLLDTGLAQEGTASLLQYLKRDEKLRGIPVILIGQVSEDNVEQLGRYLEMGADDFVYKPFSAIMLRARLTACLELKRLQSEQEAFARNDELLKIEHDVEVGHMIQIGFLPQELPQPTGWEIAARFEPAREVAGDFYDAFYMSQNRRLGFLLGDVCDKGVGAALFMTLFRSLLHAFAQQNYPERGIFDILSRAPSEEHPGQRLAHIGIASTPLMEAVLRTNNYIIENHGDTNMFATLFFAVLDPVTGAVIYVNAGHNPPAIVGPNGIKARLNPTGPAVGLALDGPFEIGQAQLDPGDLLFIFTDGVTDAKNSKGERFTEKRMLGLVTQPAQSAAGLLAGVDASVRSHIGSAAQFDDITMVAVRRAGST
jgi:phosphoserine phosphatase RsbU/P